MRGRTDGLGVLTPRTAILGGGNTAGPCFAPALRGPTHSVPPAAEADNNPASFPVGPVEDLL
jgi:hypothetical protein